MPSNTDSSECTVTYRQSKTNFCGKPCYELVGDIKFCCQDLKDAYDEDFLSFGEYEYSSLNVDHNLNIAKCYPYPEGACWDELPIKFCPFCGKEIKYVQTEKMESKIHA